jgi:hypothetical protein
MRESILLRPVFLSFMEDPWLIQLNWMLFLLNQGSAQFNIVENVFSVSILKKSLSLFYILHAVGIRCYC